jgi:hypothetical protein
MPDVTALLAAGGAAVVLLTALVIGSTELVKALFDRNYRTAALIAVSAVVGAIGGWLLLPQIGLVLGIVTGLSASGVVTGLQKIGSGTTSGARPLNG